MSTEEAKPTAGSAKELERLRDILYGEQARATEDRLGDLEKRVEKVRSELNSLFRKEQKNLQTSLEKQINALSKQLDEHQTDAAERLENTRSELNNDFTKRINDQAAQLRELRQQLVEISAALEESKVSRSDLGAVLIEMGQRILGEE
jgi:septal ring factor EnvC (AmiA/AmiB activator)